MPVFRSRRGVASSLLLGALLSMCIAEATPAGGQQNPVERNSAIRSSAPTGAATASTDRPLPDVIVLMRAVESRQRASEALQQNYIYRSSLVETRTDAGGHPKKTETREYDIFWLRGVPVQKLVAKNGRPLSADDLKKEDQRIDKEVQKARERRAKGEAAGKQTDPRGDEEITVSRMLALGRFGNARRVLRNGRDAIATDYIGDPHAKTQNRAETVFRDLAGTVWIDEQDCEVVQVEGRFARSFKIAGGLLADIHEGTSFSLRQDKIDGQVWLPTAADASGAARLLFFSVHGRVQVRNSNFRRFRATSTILPGMSVVPDPPTQ